MNIKKCAICGQPFTPKHNASKKTCYNKDCIKEYYQRYQKYYRQNNDRTAFLLNTEQLAFEWLTKNNFKPTRVTSVDYSPGIPDFKCRNNIWVEVKSAGNSNLFAIQLNQIQHFKALLNKGHTVLLMIFNANKEMTILQLNNFTKTSKLSSS